MCSCEKTLKFLFGNNNQHFGERYYSVGIAAMYTLLTIRLQKPVSLILQSGMSQIVLPVSRLAFCFFDRKII